MVATYERVFNFSAGPCTLPVGVLEEARDQLIDYKGTGMSVMEMSHRSKPFEDIIHSAEQDLRRLMDIPDGYRVLFLQGGASLQFSMIPMTFLRGRHSADYVVTGTWGKKALECALLEGKANVLFDAKAEGYRSVPDFSSLEFTSQAAYVHMTSNETIQGVEFQDDPICVRPLVCDMSSDILSRPTNVSRYAVIYAGAQKNMGPAGVVIVIMRDDMIELVPKHMHPMLDYRLQAENESLYNTPPCWSIYVCGLVYKHLLATGGLSAAKTRNEDKAKLIYDAIDRSSGFYRGHAEKQNRSRMNATFTLPNDELTAAFVKGTASLKMDGLKGHRSVGGIRASIYNAFPEEGCNVLASYMDEFRANNV